MNAFRSAVFALAVACTGADGDADSSLPTADADAFCADLEASNGSCWSDDLDQDCLDRYAECGEQITVMESCPVQLGC
jgi:hypothetical protein